MLFVWITFDIKLIRVQGGQVAVSRSDRVNADSPAIARFPAIFDILGDNSQVLNFSCRIKPDYFFNRTSDTAWVFSLKAVHIDRGGAAGSPARL